MAGKLPRTKRGQQTMRRLLDAAAQEFGENGFHEASISAITRRAGVALGSFYTYFESKEAVFRALVRDLSEQVGTRSREHIASDMDALAKQQSALASFLRFVSEHREVYRIIDESEFVTPEAYRQHYETIAARIHDRLREGQDAGDVGEHAGEAHAWAIMGMNVFLGLRYAVWDNSEDPDAIARIAVDLLRNGLSPANQP